MEGLDDVYSTIVTSLILDDETSFSFSLVSRQLSDVFRKGTTTNLFWMNRVERVLETQLDFLQHKSFDWRGIYMLIRRDKRNILFHHDPLVVGIGLMLRMELMIGRDGIYTPLFHSCDTGNMDTFRLLLNYGHIGKRTQDECLFLLEDRCRPDMKKVLLDISGIVPDNMNHLGSNHKERKSNVRHDVWGSFRSSCINSRVEMVEFMLKSGRVNPSIRKNILIKNALDKGHVGLVRVLYSDKRVKKTLDVDTTERVKTLIGL